MPVRGVSASNWISKGRVGAQQPVLTARTAWRLSQSRPNEKCRPVPLSWVILRVKRQDPKSRRPGAPDLESVQPRSAALCPLPEVLPSSAIEGVLGKGLPLRLAEPCADEKGSGPLVSPLPPPGAGAGLLFGDGNNKAVWFACRWRAPIHSSPAPSLKAADTVGLNSKNRGNYNTWSQAPGRVASKLSLVSKAQLKMKSQINRNRNPGKALGGWFSLKGSRDWKCLLCSFWSVQGRVTVTKVTI